MVERVLVIRSGNAVAARTLALPAAVSGKDKSQSLIVTTGNDGGHVLEVQRVKQFFSSWLVEKEISSDGGMFLASPVDPLFVVLPFLERSRKRPAGTLEGGYYCSVDQVLDVPELPDLKLLSGAVSQHLSLICDSKEVGGEEFFRLNDDRVVAWLLCKLTLTLEALEGVLRGMDQESKLAYGIGFLGEYVSEHWTSILASHLKLDIAAIAGSGSVGSTRPASLSMGVELEANGVDYKKPKVALVDPKVAAKKKAEETRQANKAKDAQGTKSITSFFRPRG